VYGMPNMMIDVALRSVWGVGRGDELFIGQGWYGTLRIVKLVRHVCGLESAAHVT